MSKKSIPAKTRWGLIILLSLLLLGAAGMTAWSFLQPLQEQIQAPLCTFKQQASVDYQVRLKSNEFFSEEYAGPGRAYLFPLTDGLETVLNYSCSSQGETGAVRITGQYRVTAVLSGYVMKNKEGNQGYEKQRVLAWEKSVEIVPLTAFAGDKDSLEIHLPVTVDVNSYVDFVDNLRKAYRVSVETVELVLLYDINTSVETEKGSVDEQLRPLLLIPLGGDTYMIEGSPADQKENSINIDLTVPVPKINTYRMVGSAATSVMLLLLLLVIFRTRVAKQDPSERELQRIMKKYGDHIVAVDRLPAGAELQALAMNSIEDLVKAADEVGQPILYGDQPTGWHVFYVLDQSVVYSFMFPASLPAEEGEGSSPSREVEGQASLPK